MNVYNWGDAGETAGVWPGTAMTAEADGWYTYTIETEVPLNLVFSATGGSPQSSNVNDVAVDAGEIWVTIGAGEGANDMGAATNEAVLNLEPQEGWPSAAAAVEDTAATDTAATDTAVTDTTATDTTAEDTAATDVPKTGETVLPAFTFLALAAIAGAAVIVLKKKEQTNEN
jgi:LPXTG-motif cell wall-anchored protein